MAVTSVVGQNVYLAAVRQKMALASIFSGTVTVPIFMISALLVSSFLGAGGEISLTPTSIIMLAIAALVIRLSIFGFLREASKHISNAPGGRGSSPTGPVSMQGEAWEESPRKEEGEE